MEASAVSHIAICTRDMEKSLAFYRDMLGMQVLAGGRPQRAKYFRDAREFEAVMVALIHQLDQAGKSVTTESLARYLLQSWTTKNLDSAAKQLRRYYRRFWLPLDELIRRARP